MPPTALGLGLSPIFLPLDSSAGGGAPDPDLVTDETVQVTDEGVDVTDDA